MKVAVDSNVISALWTGEPASPHCRTQLESARLRGGIVICAPVYCELHACPGISRGLVSDFLRDTEIVCDFEMGAEVWREAAVRFARYADRRRKSGGQSAKRILVDFVVGAHALVRTDGLLTLDRERYARDFPDLKLF